MDEKDAFWMNRDKSGRDQSGPYKRKQVPNDFVKAHNRVLFIPLINQLLEKLHLHLIALWIMEPVEARVGIRGMAMFLDE